MLLLGVMPQPMLNVTQRAAAVFNDQIANLKVSGSP
jgi:hypothetical protein